MDNGTDQSLLETLLTEEMSRGALLRAGAVGALSVSALGALARAGQATAAPAIISATPGKVVVAHTGPVGNLDPNGPAAIDPPTAQVLIACYERLVNVPLPADPNELKAARARGFRPEPAFASSWFIGSDRKYARFNLRSGAKSSRGNVLGAPDVKFMIEKTFAARGLGRFLMTLSGVRNPDSVTVVNDRTVDFALTAPSPFFLQVLGLQYYPIYDSVEVKKNATTADPFGTDWLSRNIAGTGPYALGRVAPGGTTATLIRRRNYNGPRPAKVNMIVQQAVTDNNSRLTLLLSKNSDFSPQLTPKQLATAAKNPASKVVRFPATRGMYLIMNNNTAPFDDPDVRRAIAQAIPYDAIIKSLYAGQAERWKTLVNPFLAGATDKYWNYDGKASQARTTLAKLSGQTLKLQYQVSSATGQLVAVVLQSTLSNFGVKVEIEQLEDAVYNSRKFARQLPFALNDIDTPIIPNIFYNLQLFFTSTGLLNYAGYRSSDYDKTIADLVAAYGKRDAKTQASLIDTAQRILAEDMPVVPIAYTGSTQAMAKNVTIRGAASATGATFNYRDFKVA